ncbi:MAG: SsrA-binding protein SmpB [bacterium]
MNKKITNKEARFDYEILEDFEAGLILKSDEIKAIRSGRVNLKGSYAKIFYESSKPAVFLVGSHFFTSSVDPYRTRKLLLHKKEISRLVGKAQEKGLTLIPLEIYITRGKAKLRLALGRGKKNIDKRETIKRREENRNISRVLKERA